MNNQRIDKRIQNDQTENFDSPTFQQKSSQLCEGEVSIVQLQHQPLFTLIWLDTVSCQHLKLQPGGEEGDTLKDKRIVPEATPRGGGWGWGGDQAGPMEQRSAAGSG